MTTTALVNPLVEVRQSVRDRFPVRALNRGVLGRCPFHPNAPCGCDYHKPAACSCGKAVAETGMVLVSAAADGRVSAGPLATCKSNWVCDFCSRRHQAEMRERVTWHYERHRGSVAMLTFTCRHSSTSRLAPLLGLLTGAQEALRKSVAWKDLPIVSWVRSLEITYSQRNGWHPHLHVLLFLPPMSPGLESELEGRLQAAWNARLEKRGGVGGAGSVDGSYREDLSQVLYPFKYAPEKTPSEWDTNDWEPENNWADGDSWSDDDPGVSPWDLAARASVGDRRATTLWLEFFAATKGKQRVSFSQDLRSEWNARDEAEVVEESSPVALVASDVWNKAWARSAGDDGLRACASAGVDGMAEFWGSVLSAPVVVGEAFGLPFVHFDSSYQEVGSNVQGRQAAVDDPSDRSRRGVRGVGGIEGGVGDGLAAARDPGGQGWPAADEGAYRSVRG